MRGTRKTIATQVLLVLPAVVLLNTGCLTRSLWQAETVRPAHNPNLALAVAPDSADVLVQYNEKQPDKVRRRSYWLFDYVSDTGGAGKPKFVRPKAYSDLDLAPIPLSVQNPPDDSMSVAGFVAVPSKGARGFELRRYGVPLGHFELPIYQVDAKPTFGRVALTPLAAVADGVITVSATVTVVGVLVLVESLEDDSEWPDIDCSSSKHKSGGLHATHRSD
jgi:hypothetical protein